jgi:hypothetical protein
VQPNVNACVVNAVVNVAAAGATVKPAGAVQATAVEPVPAAPVPEPVTEPAPAALKVIGPGTGLNVTVGLVLVTPAIGQLITAVALAGFGPGVAVCVHDKVDVVMAAPGVQDKPIAAAVVVTVCEAPLVIAKLPVPAGIVQANTVLPVPAAGVVMVGVTEPVPAAPNVVAATANTGAVLAAVAAGQVNAQVRVNGEPATVGVAVSVQANDAVAAAAARVHDKLIEPVVVPVLKMPPAGVVVTAPNEAAPAPVMAQPVTAD